MRSFLVFLSVAVLVLVSAVVGGSVSAQTGSAGLCVIPGATIGPFEEDVAATFSADGSTVAFEDTTTSPRQLVIRSVDGSGAGLVVPGRIGDRIGLSADGQTVAFEPSSPNDTTVVYEAVGGVWSSSPVDSLDLRWPSISSDGNVVAGEGADGSGLVIADRAAGTETEVGAPSGLFYSDPNLSGDGSTVAYIQRIPSVGGKSLYVYDISSGTSTLISGIGTSQRSAPASLSSDGRFVAFQPGIASPENPVSIHDRDLDQNGIFDETAAGSTETVTIAATEWPQTRDGQLIDEWNVVNAAISGDGTRLTVLADLSGSAGQTFGATAIEQIDLSTGAVIATSASNGLITPTNQTQLKSSTDGVRAVFASLEDLVPADTNGSTDLYLFTPTGDCAGPPVLTITSSLPSLVKAGEVFPIDIEISNPSAFELDTANMGLLEFGDGLDETILDPTMILPPTIAPGATETITVEVRAARVIADATLDFDIGLVEIDGVLITVLASDSGSLVVEARPSVPVHFTLAQLVGCEQEEPVSPICDTDGVGGGPDGGGDDGEYIVRVRFEEQFEEEFSGKREEFGDFNERMFFLMSEQVIPTADTVTITVEAFDDDDEEGMFGAPIAGASIGAADQQIDVSPENDELTATINYDAVTGSWRVDGASDPGPDRVHHWTRGDGDYDMATGTGHPGLVSFDISSLAPNLVLDGKEGDSDGDGLLDGWETFGLHVLPVSRTTPLNAGDLPRDSTPVTGPEIEYAVLDRSWADAVPDVDFPDLYVENDWLTDGTTEIQPADQPKNGHTYQTIVEAFAAGRGIDLWIDAAPQVGNGASDLGGSGVVELSTTNAINTSVNASYVCNVNSAEFNTVKDVAFNVNRRWVFRYGLTGDQPIFTLPVTVPPAPPFPCGSGGNAEVGGNDMLMLRRDALVFMHELGHSLGLRHGGFEPDNCKPNYVSVMNYWYDNTQGILTASGDYVYDFAPAALAGGARPQNGPLIESALDETTPPNLSNAEHAMRFINGAGVESQRALSQVQDYNGDFDFVDNPIAVDLDTRASASAASGFVKDCEPSPGETLTSYDDWGNLSLSFRDNAAAADGAELDIPDDSHLDPTEAEALAFTQGFARVDVAIDLDGTYDPATALLTLNANLIGVDNPLVVRPAVSFTLNPDVTLVGSPPECVAVTTAIVECVLDSIVANTTPTPPTTVSLQLSLNAGATTGAVTATGTSQDNPINNDPDATNNTAQLDLVGLLGSAPVAGDDEELTLAGDTIDIDVLGNDTDVDDDLDPASLQITVAPTLGTAEVTNDGDGPMITYTAGPNSGTDTLTYQICDLAGNCDQATLTIEITAEPGSAPVAGDDEELTLAGDTIDIDVLGNDTDVDDDLDPASLQITVAPTLGTAEVTNDGDGPMITYTAGPNSGTDTLTYQICDLAGNCDQATLTIEIMGDSDCTIVGTSADDVLIGTEGDDVICARGGNDIIDALGGNDVVFGGRGADTIDGGIGDDRLVGGRGADIIHGGPDNDWIRGRRGSDTITGGPGTDEIHGNRGDDDIDGGNNDDLLRGGRGADTIRGGKGNDIIYGGKHADDLRGNAGDDTIFGKQGADTIRGGKGNDTLFGNRGADLIVGGQDTDVFFGGQGQDECIIDTTDGPDPTNNCETITNE